MNREQSLIPHFIVNDTGLSPMAKIIYGELLKCIDEKGLCKYTKTEFSKRLSLVRGQVTKCLKELRKKGYVKTYYDSEIVDLLKAKKMKGLGIGSKICAWCEVGTHVFHAHHYPVPKSKGGTELINICPNCHVEFHYLERRDQIVLEPEQIQYIIEDRGRQNDK